jgi:hypothetical protein
MNNFRTRKLVSSLPSTLEPNAVYFVRAGIGFDLYCTDQTGSIAHKLNSVSQEYVDTKVQILEVIITNITLPGSVILPIYPRQRTIIRLGGLQNSREESTGTTTVTVSFGTSSFTPINGLSGLNCSPTILADQGASINNEIPANRRLRFSWGTVNNGPINISCRVDFTDS